MPVIRELDDKKHDLRLKDRARKAIAKIQDIKSRGMGVREGVVLRLLHEDISREAMPPGCDPDNRDDQILAHVVRLNADEPERQVGVVTADFGLEIKCNAMSIPVFRPPEGKRLSDVGSEQDRKHREMQAKLQRLERRLPDLRVLASVEYGQVPSDCAEFQLDPPPEALDVAAELAVVQGEHPAQSPPGPRTEAAIAAYARGIRLDPSEEEYARYEAERAQYFARYAEYVEELNAYRDGKARSFRAAFHLENTGSCPAVNVDVHLHVPDGVRLHEGNDEVREPESPDPPIRPRTSSQIAAARLAKMAESGIPSAVTHMLLPGMASPTRPSIRRSQSYDVDFSAGDLKHGYTRHLYALEFTFDLWDAVRSFHVDYICRADNHPDAQTGQLHFVLADAKGPT